MQTVLSTKKNYIKRIVMVFIHFKNYEISLQLNFFNFPIVFCKIHAKNFVFFVPEHSRVFFLNFILYDEFDLLNFSIKQILVDEFNMAYLFEILLFIKVYFVKSELLFKINHYKKFILTTHDEPNRLGLIYIDS